MSVAPLSILTDIQLPVNTRVLSTPDSGDSITSSNSMTKRNRNHAKSDDCSFDIANRRPTYSPNSENELYYINKEKLTQKITEQLTEQIAKKLTDELADKICKDMKQHMIETLSNININPKPPPKKCCMIS
jgi:hypothetical protein